MSARQRDVPSGTPALGAASGVCSGGGETTGVSSTEERVPRWTDHTDKSWPVEVVPAWAYDKLKRENDELRALLTDAAGWLNAKRAHIESKLWPNSGMAQLEKKS